MGVFGNINKVAKQFFNNVVQFGTDYILGKGLRSSENEIEVDPQRVISFWESGSNYKKNDLVFLSVTVNSEKCIKIFKAINDISASEKLPDKDSNNWEEYSLQFFSSVANKCLNIPSSEKENLDLNTAARHTHENKGILDKIETHENVFTINVILDADFNLSFIDKTHAEVLEAYKKGYKIVAHIEQQNDENAVELASDVELTTYDSINNVFGFSLSWENLTYNFSLFSDDAFITYITELSEKGDTVSYADTANFAHQADSAYYADEAANANYAAEAYSAEYSKEADYAERSFVAEHADRFMLTGHSLPVDFLANYDGIYMGKTDTALLYRYVDGKIKFFEVSNNDEVKEIPVHIPTDNTPTKDSDNLITSGGVYDALNYDLIGETEITEADITEAGEEGITAITVEFQKTLENFTEIIFIIQMPKNEANSAFVTSSTTSAHATIAGATNVTESLNVNNSFLSSQSQNFAPIFYKYSNKIIIKIAKTKSGSCFYTQYMLNGFGTIAYPYTMYAAVNSLSRNINDYRFFSFRDRNLKFYFPAGTKMKVYAR